MGRSESQVIGLALRALFATLPREGEPNALLCHIEPSRE
jgi:hypothetical protein